MTLVTRGPDFIVGGAPRAATTWLARAAARHPGIAMNVPISPEPKFFLVPEVFALGLEHYGQTWFGHARPGALWGEKTTNYLESGEAARRIHACLPDVRLVFVLRDPVERAISNYFWSRRNGLEKEDPARALDPERESKREADLPEVLRYARPFSYVSRGLYARLLAPWLALFPRKRVLVLRHEDVERRPAEFLCRLHRFLALEERPEDADGLGLVNEVERDVDVPEAVRRRLEDTYVGPNQELARVLGMEFDWAPGRR